MYDCNECFCSSAMQWNGESCSGFICGWKSCLSYGSKTASSLFCCGGVGRFFYFHGCFWKYAKWWTYMRISGHQRISQWYWDCTLSRSFWWACAGQHLVLKHMYLQIWIEFSAAPRAVYRNSNDTIKFLRIFTMHFDQSLHRSGNQASSLLIMIGSVARHKIKMLSISKI